MKIKQAFSVLFIALFMSTAHAKVEHFNLNMSKSRVVSFEMIRAKNAKLPTLLFLPGVNRGLLANDEALETMAEKGYGIVTMNFSTQPISVSELTDGVKPDFRTKTYKFSDLTEEVYALSNELKKNFNVKTVIPVSISFSSAVSSTLENFPLIIDAVPMTASAAVNPELENYIAYLKAGEIWNPVFGPGITRSLLDQAYYQKWRPQVDSMIENFNLKVDRKDDMVEGYTVFSRASEGFVWDLKKTAPTTRRVFLFAKDDSESLLKNQLELFLKAMDSTPNALAFLVKDSGHVLPNDQPAAYAQILTYLLTNDIKDVSGIFEVNPTTGKSKLYTGEEAKKFAKSIIQSL